MKKPGNENTLSILISEDDPDDHYLFRSAFLEVNRSLRISNVLTGRQLIERLLREAVFSPEGNPKIPDLIVADLKKPFFDLDIIREIRVYSQFNKIPIYLFSIEDSAPLKQKAIEAGATAFYNKPYTFFDLRRIVREIVEKTVSKN